MKAQDGWLGISHVAENLSHNQDHEAHEEWVVRGKPVVFITTTVPPHFYFVWRTDVKYYLLDPEFEHTHTRYLLAVIKRST